MTIGRCEADAACYTSCRRALDSGKSVRQREPLDKRELRARRRMLASHTAVGTRLLKVSESPRATKRSGDASQTPHAIESCRRSELDSGKSVSRAGCLSLRPASPLSHKTSGSCGALGHHERVVRRAPSRMSVGTTECARADRGPVSATTSSDALGLRLSRARVGSIEAVTQLTSVAGLGKRSATAATVSAHWVCFNDELHIRLRARTFKPRGPTS